MSIAALACSLPLMIASQTQQHDSAAAQPASMTTTSAPASGSQSGAASTPPAAEASEPRAFEHLASSPYKLTFAPYLWVIGTSGNATVGNVKIDATATFRDVLDASDSLFGLMGVTELQVGKVFFQLNATYVSIGFDKKRDVRNFATLDAELDQKLGWYEGAVGYRLIDQRMSDRVDEKQRFALDVFGGARVTDITVDAHLNASAAVTLPDGEVVSGGRSAERNQDETWVEPFVGTRLRFDLTDRWEFSLRGDVGGFGVDGSSFSWQTAALMGYTWELGPTSIISAYGGYRALGQDYSSGDFGWNVVAHGPILGMQVVFGF